jgi:hypothetical protein
VVAMVVEFIVAKRRYDMLEVILDILLLVICYLIIIDIKHNVSSIIYEQRVKAKLKLLEEKNKE